MMETPSWVARLQSSVQQGGELLSFERNKSTIDTERLADYINTKEGLKRQERLLAILRKDEAFDKKNNYFEGRVDKYTRSLMRAKRLAQLQKQHKWDEEELSTALELVSEPIPYTLHWLMFIPTIRQQGTPEQHKLFLTKAENFEIIGCFAQTELGHGSNVRGLETTATWSPTDKTFILTSPTLTASKWWAGALGRTANHAIIMAQLSIDNVSHGPHLFICQIRDLATHQPLDGVYIGDIGPKLGYNTMDNGFLLLNKVKIPHINMLARYGRVDPETSKYIHPPSPVLVYGTLTRTRATIVRGAGHALARGATIATRYCAVRRQFSDRDQPSNPKELQVLDYSTVQDRLLPQIAASFAMHITGEAMMEMYTQATTSTTFDDAGIDQAQSKQIIAELHATSCGLKALATTTAAEGLEICRRACGGHGYSSFSGIASQYADYLPSTTYEGDNYILTQQVASYLMNTARDVLKGKPANNITGRNLSQYLSSSQSRLYFDLSRGEDICRSFGHRAAYLTFETVKRRDEDGLSWNELLVNFWRLSTAHSQYLAVKAFHDALTSERASSTLDEESHRILWKLLQLFGIHTVVAEAHEFYVSSALSVEQVEEARNKTKPLLLGEIRPHAVRLVDAWKVSDWSLDSSLGRYDGAVYQDLFHRASQDNPLNDVVPDPYPGSANTAVRGSRSATRL